MPATASPTATSRPTIRAMGYPPTTGTDEAVGAFTIFTMTAGTFQERKGNESGLPPVRDGPGHRPHSMFWIPDGGLDDRSVRFPVFDSEPKASRRVSWLVRVGTWTGRRHV